MKYPWKPLKFSLNTLQHPLNTFETPLKHPWKTLKYPWSNIKKTLKHPLNTLKTPHSWDTLDDTNETPFEHPYASNALSTPDYNKQLLTHKHTHRLSDIVTSWAAHGS